MSVCSSAAECRAVAYVRRVGPKILTVVCFGPPGWLVARQNFARSRPRTRYALAVADFQADRWRADSNVATAIAVSSTSESRSLLASCQAPLPR